MAYIPTIWQIGDIITAEKLNKLENAIAETSAIYQLMLNDPSTLMTGDDLYAAIQDNPDTLYYINGALIMSISYEVDIDSYQIQTTHGLYTLSADDTTIITHIL